MTRSERIKRYFTWLSQAKSEQDLETILKHVEQYFKTKENQQVPESIYATYRKRLEQIIKGE